MCVCVFISYFVYPPTSHIWRTTHSQKDKGKRHRPKLRTALKSKHGIYIGGPKRDALHLSIESSILGSLHSFSFSLLIAKKKVSLVRHPQLINMKHKQYGMWSFFSCPLLTFLYRSLSFTPEDVGFLLLFFFLGFLMLFNWCSSKENLATFGYRPHMKVSNFWKPLISRLPLRSCCGNLLIIILKNSKLCEIWIFFSKESLLMLLAPFFLDNGKNSPPKKKKKKPEWVRGGGQFDILKDFGVPNMFQCVPIKFSMISCSPSCPKQHNMLSGTFAESCTRFDNLIFSFSHSNYGVYSKFLNICETF